MTPITIAHRAGNSREALERALAAGIDAIEADLRLDGGQLVVRHERRLRFLPIFVDRWHVRWDTSQQITLTELLKKTRDKASLFLDIKSKSVDAVRALRETLREGEAIERSRVSTTYWHLLEPLRREEPDLRVYYSIGDERDFGAFNLLADGGLAGVGISARHDLLTETRVRRLVSRGVEIVAYHVNDVERARRLLGWGVTGITSGDLELLRTVKEPRAKSA